MKVLLTVVLAVASVIFIYNLPYLLRVWRWNVKDLIHAIRHPREVHLYGIWLYCGLYGQGKTMALTEYLTRMRRRYGDKIYISTNYGFSDEDFPLNDWRELLTEYDKPVIFGYDEIQNEFNSRDYKNFPYELVKLLTQNRKGHGKQIVGTAQRFGRVDKTIRELCTHVVECKRAWFGRVTKTRKYDVEDYEMYLNEIDVVKKRKVPYKRYKFIQTDALRAAYDSFLMIESAKTKEYVSASEKLALSVAEKLN
jgi:ATP-dependent Clp protease ATP-binding subunit ClpX